MIERPSKQALARQVEQDLGGLSRRTLVKGVLLLTAGAATLGVAGCSRKTSAPGLKVLTASEEPVFARLIQVLLPTSGTALAPVEKVPVVSNIDHLFQMLDPKVRSDLGSAVTLFEYGSLVMGGHFTRFPNLDDGAAVAYIDQWQNGGSIQRGIVTTLKKLVYASYWRDESTWPAVEFDGPVSVRWGLPSLGNAPLPVETSS